MVSAFKSNNKCFLRNFGVRLGKNRSLGKWVATHIFPSVFSKFNVFCKNEALITVVTII